MASSKLYSVTVTCSTAEEAHYLSREAVKLRLAACAQVSSSPITSYYHWQGALREAQEYVLQFKTAETRLPKLQEFILHNHSYDCPQFIAVRLEVVSPDYAAWIEQETT
jgi:periplasmic divalent cation tolerance protein